MGSRKITNSFGRVFKLDDENFSLGFAEKELPPSVVDDQLFLALQNSVEDVRYYSVRAQRQRYHILHRGYTLKDHSEPKYGAH